MNDDDFVSEGAIDYAEILRRGGQNLGDEDFAFFKCPSCGRVYLLESEVGTVYLDPRDLARRFELLVESTFTCEACSGIVPREGWAGPRAKPEFMVTWAQFEASDWAWAARP